MRIDIITIFPDYLTPLELSLVGRARATGALDVHVHDLRHWTHDVHRTVDDTPYGGGPGMVMRPEPWGEALDHVTAGVTAGPPRAPADQESGDLPWLVIPSPAGVPFTQRLAETLAARPWLVFACGRYEGIDQRVHDHVADRMPVTEVSIGDYVVFGGEVATLVVVEAVTRLLPGVLGNAASLEEESHTGGVLEAPMYTKPAEWRGHEVPAVLRSGDHARIDRWRRDQSLLRTLARRPDLLAALSPDTLSRQDLATLAGAGFQADVTDVAE